VEDDRSPVSPDLEEAPLDDPAAAFATADGAFGDFPLSDPDEALDGEADLEVEPEAEVDLIAAVLGPDAARAPDVDVPTVPPAEFCHLHVHTDFSALDGACKVVDIVRKAKEMGMPAVAVTDHGMLAGVVQFYREATKMGVKPIIGLETYVVEDRFRKDAQTEHRWHLTLLARNDTGYKNLLKLGSRAFLEGYYFKPRTDYALLKEHAEGIICLSGCPTGRLSRAMEHGRMEEARGEIERLIGIFGREDVYIEVQQTGIGELAHVTPRLVELAAELDLPLVATNDVHYLNEDDARAHDVLLCIQTGARLSDEKRMRFSTEEFYFKSEAQMREAFRDYPEAIDNTVVLAARCDVTIELGGMLLPSYPVPPGFDDEVAYLRHLCDKGLTRRYGDTREPAVLERMATELATIEQMGYPPYFLIVWDFVAYAKDNGIAVGPGRGSAAGSLVSYLLGITDLDPLTYDLLFERFLNPARISMPDIDIDFSVEGRERVIEYVADKYGRDRVAQIATFGTIKARQALRDAARVMDVPYGEADRIAKLIPNDPKITLAECLKEKADLRQEYDRNDLVRQVVDVALPLEGLIRQDSIHAAGVVISDKPLTDYLPLMQKSGAEVVTQVSMTDVEQLGLLKMDFLGLRNLDVMDWAVKIIRAGAAPDFDLEAAPLDDVKTYEMLAKGDSEGVFQFESSGMREALREIVPTVFNDLIALVALYRPGPMEFIPAYARNKRNPSLVTFPDPRLAEILRSTYGVAIYQEQLMEISKRIGGFTPAEADDLRKAIGKKSRAILDRLQPKFREGALANGTDPKVTDHLWGLMEKAGDYSFNKSHAACYALISYRTAFLKANYPVEYMAALISSVMSTKDKVPYYVSVANDMGIEVLPPDINESALDFRVVEARIRFGLSAVKNVGESAIRSIVSAREQDGRFHDLFEFCERVELSAVNKRALESLIKAGALDSTGASRRGMLSVLPQAMAHAQKLQSDSALGQGSIFDFLGAPEPATATAAKGANGAPSGNGTVSSSNGGNGTITTARSRNGFSGPPPVVIPAGDFSREELLALEKETLGLYLSSHPLRDLRRQVRDGADHLISQLGDLPDGSVTTVIGMVGTVKRITTKKGDQMAFLTLDGLEGSVEVLCFPTFYAENKHLLVEDKVVKLKVKVDRKDENETKLIPLAIEAFTPPPENPPVCILLDGDRLPAGVIEDLKALVARFPGLCPVEVKVASAGGGVRLRLGDGFKVEPQASLFAELRVLLGEQCVGHGLDALAG
jgi:DNA polymerase III subunit alpha